MLGRLTTILLIASAAIPAASAGTTAVEGAVVDAAGKPVKGVEVAARWELVHGVLVSFDGELSDATGAFRIVLDAESERVPVLAYDAARKASGLAWFDPKQSSARISVTLSPVSLVSLTPATDLAAMPADAELWVGAEGDSPPIILTRAAGGRVVVPLPAGDYRVDVYGPDRERGKLEHLAVESGAAETDGGEVRLPASSISQWFGKPPPALTISDARGIEKETGWDQLRGKWVLLEFWGFW